MYEDFYLNSIKLELKNYRPLDGRERVIQLVNEYLTHAFTRVVLTPRLIAKGLEIQTAVRGYLNEMAPLKSNGQAIDSVMQKVDELKLLMDAAERRDESVVEPGVKG